MTTISHEPSGALDESRRRTSQLLVPEMWASIAIVVMWLAVLIDAIVGPKIVTHTAGGVPAPTGKPKFSAKIY